MLARTGIFHERSTVALLVELDDGAAVGVDVGGKVVRRAVDLPDASPTGIWFARWQATVQVATDAERGIVEQAASVGGDRRLLGAGGRRTRHRRGGAAHGQGLEEAAAGEAHGFSSSWASPSPSTLESLAP